MTFGKSASLCPAPGGLEGKLEHCWGTMHWLLTATCLAVSCAWGCGTSRNPSGDAGGSAADAAGGAKGDAGGSSGASGLGGRAGGGASGTAGMGGAGGAGGGSAGAAGSGGSGGTRQGGAYYGSGLASDSLNNTRIGPYGLECSYRFRAEYSAPLSGCRPYIIFTSTKPGYSGGTGGTLRFRLERDDGTADHLPSGRVLGQATETTPLDNGSFPLIQFASPVLLRAGQLYHIVVDNTDSSPSVNYVSTDHLFLNSPNAAPAPMQPTLSDTDWAELVESNSSGWAVDRRNTPILALYYSDGSTQGMGYMEVWVGSPHTVSGQDSVREIFTVSGSSRTVSALHVRIKRDSGTDPLLVRIEKNDGTQVVQASVSASSVPTSYQWITCALPASPTLAAGGSYRLVLQTAPTSTYEAYPIRRGVYYSFPDTTFFHDGYAQYTTGSTWFGWNQWGVNDRKEQDLQFYFDVSAP